MDIYYDQIIRLSQDWPETVHYVEDFIGAKAEIDFPPPFGQNMAIIKRRS